MLIENQLKKLGFGTAAVFLLIVAILLGSGPMYLMAVIMGLVPFAGWVVNRIIMQGLICTRSAPETADENGRILVTITLENAGYFPKFYLRVIDSLPRYIRFAGSPEGEPAFVTRLWPGETARIRYYLEPQKRGLHRIGPLTVQATDVFGFGELRALIKQYDEVLVYPSVLPVREDMISNGASVGFQDEQDSQSRGEGSNFTGVREYRVGDQMRRINWRATARTGMLTVSEYSQGFAGDIIVVLDCAAAGYKDSGTGQISAFEYGVTIASSLGIAALRRGNGVQLLLAGASNLAEDTLQLRGETGVGILLNRLAGVEPIAAPDDGRSLAADLRAAAGAIKPGTSGLIITPQPQDNPAVRASLEAWTLPPLSTSVRVFWLDAPSFAAAELAWRTGNSSRHSTSLGGQSSCDNTQLGIEHIVNADSSLTELLSGESSCG